ncbi:hypothetical protein GP486_004874 [Trichoglossum hirsutum]|uniref:Uncharacterized protein n=1 Tax=Trichoglossum hirsutum TaxID=265104 RepID=A0A9P8RNU8_9PEZI|nr:hypothetical protein GP486_004874 [Trichoglossum hirsutum]
MRLEFILLPLATTAMSINWDRLSHLIPKGAGVVDNAKANVAEIGYNGLSQMVSDALSNTRARIPDIDYRAVPKKSIDALEAGFVGVKQHDISQAVVKILGRGKDQVLAIDYGALGSELQDYIKAHPYQTTFHVVNGIVYFYPGVAWVPLVRSLGFSLNGPMALSLASKFQAALGNVPARHVFSFLQSAAMNGYGAAPVANAVRVSAVAAEAMLLWGGKGNKETCDVAVDEEGEVPESGDSRCECDGEGQKGASGEGGDIKSKL